MVTGAVLCLLSVVFGAFGAHRFEALLTANGRMETYELAVRYQFFHGLAFLFAGLWTGQSKWAGGYAWLAGVILFCGSLYTLSLTNSTAPVVVFSTPAGGLMFIIGWVSIIAGLIRRQP